MAKNLERIEAEITLKDNGFTDAIKRVNQKTSDYKRQAESTSTSNHILAESFRSTAQGIAVVDGPLGGVASRFSSVSSLISGTSLAVVGFGAAISGVALLMTASVGAGEQMERQLYKQEAILKATGYAAGFSASQLDNMARSMAFATLGSVEGFREAQNVLLTFRRIQGDVFRDAVDLSQDLSVSMGGTAASNAKMLGRALEDPVAGVSALTRAGVTFTNQQKDVIKRLVETGDAATAQRLILDELATTIGKDTAEGEAKGLSGAVDTLGQQFQTLFENINKTTGASEGVTWFVNQWAGIFGDVASALEETEKELTDRINGLFQKGMEVNEQIQNSTTKSEREFYETRRKAIEKELNEALALQRGSAQKEVDQYNKSKATQKEIRERDAADRLATAQAEGLNSVVLLEQNLETEQGKVERQYRERLKALQELVLSEEQLEERGFSSITELRDSYGADLKKQYETEKQALLDKITAEQLAKDRAADRDEARRQREADREAKEQERAKDRSDKGIERIESGFVKMFGSAADYERMSYRRQKRQLKNERENAIDHNAWSFEQQKDHERALLLLKETHAQREKDAERSDMDQAISDQLQFTSMFVEMAGSRNKKLAAIGKAAAIYQIGLNTAKSVMGAWNSVMEYLPFPANVIAGGALTAALVAYGAEQISDVRSQQAPSYHTGGIAGLPSDNYGARLKSGEINATLMRGEEVLTADDPRHRNNLQIYESGNYGASNSSVVNMGGINVSVSGSGDPNLVAQQVTQQVSAQLSSFVRSKSFQNATVGAVSQYAKKNAGRIPNTR